jgi:hypothetical protein
MKTQSLFRILGVLFSILIISLPVLAQDGFGDPGDDVPVDGGLTLLAAAGIGYGAKKLRDKKRKIVKN